MRWRIAVATLAFFGGSLHASGQQRDVQRLDGSTIAASQIDESVKQLMQKAHVTGVGIALFHGGKIAYLKAYGYRESCDAPCSGAHNRSRQAHCAVSDKAARRLSTIRGSEGRRSLPRNHFTYAVEPYQRFSQLACL